MDSSKVEYEIRQLGFLDSELNEVSGLFKTSFGNDSLNLRTLRWQYVNNPLGQAVGFNAYHGATLAAHYVAIPTQLKFGGRIVNGILSINTATHPEHQGKGLFTRLAERTYELAVSRGHKFCVGVANQNSFPGFVRKLGFVDLGALESRLILAKGSLVTRPLDALDLEGYHDAEVLNWRLSRPGRIYQFFRRDGETRIFAPTARPGYSALVKRTSATDVRIRSGRPNVRSHQPQIEPGLPSRSICLWLGKDASIHWRRTLSVRIPDRFRQVKLHLILKDLGGGFAVNPDRLSFWPLDFDAY